MKKFLADLGFKYIGGCGCRIPKDRYMNNDNPKYSGWEIWITPNESRMEVRKFDPRNYRDSQIKGIANANNFITVFNYWIQ